MKGIELYEPNGCGRCTKGYRGRRALLETMPMSEDLRRIVVAGGSSIDVKDQALKEGMIALRRVGLNNALKGNTSVQEVLAITRLDK